MTYRGEVRGGVVVLEPGASLPDGTLVMVQPIQRASIEGEPLASMGDLAVDTGIEDLASDADHYIYGHPKDNHAE